MTRKLYEEQSVQKLANSIRNANGETDKYKIAEFASKVRPWTPRHVRFSNDKQWTDGYDDLRYFNAEKLVSVEGMFEVVTATKNYFYKTDIEKIFNSTNKIKSAKNCFHGNNLSTMMAYRSDEPMAVAPVNINLPECEDVSGMFESCASLGDLDRITFNLPKVKNVSRMFAGSQSGSPLGNTYPVSKWNIPDGVIMNEMFYKLPSTSGPAFINFGNGRIAPSSVYRLLAGANLVGPGQDLSSFDFYMCSDFREMFRYMNSNGGQHIVFKENQVVPNGATFKNMFRDVIGGYVDFTFMKNIICIQPKDVNGMFLVKEASGYGQPYAIDVSGIRLSNCETQITEFLPSYISGSYVIVGTESDKTLLSNLYRETGWVRDQAIRVGG